MLNDLHAIVSRGPHIGVKLKPHVQGGWYVVSPTKFKKDQIKVPLHEALAPYLLRGLKLRMSGVAGRGASLISPDSITGWK